MLISPAFAQDAAAQGPGLIGSLMPMVLILVVFYFLLIRPQNKRAKEHRAMLAAIGRGDRIVTSGGIVGTVTKVVDDEQLQVEIADGVKVRVMRSMVAQCLDKTAPVADKSADDKAEKAETEAK